MHIRRQTKRLPHAHDGEANARTLGPAEPGVKLAHARLRAMLAAEPDRPAAHKVADHDPVGVTLRIEISSTPITCGPGVPARLSWACMYCMSSALTVCQSSANSSATS